MFARSPEFDLAVRNGAPVYVEVSISLGSTVQLVPVAPGATVTIDDTAEVRRTATLTVVDNDGSLSTSTNLLSPYGPDMIIKSGFIIDGEPQTVPLGIFPIEKVTRRQGSFDLTGGDRSIKVINARFEAPYVIPANTNTGFAIQGIISSQYPGAVFSPLDFSTVSASTVPLTVFEEGDKSGNPWRNVRDLAQTDGLEVLVDQSGTFVLRRIPTAGIDPVVFDYDSASTSSILITAENETTSIDVYNVVIVTGEGTAVAGTAPVRASAEITDIANPLHPSLIGRRPLFYSSPFVTSDPIALVVAQSLLERRAGGTETLQFTAAPHPAHDGGDVVRVHSTVNDLDILAVLSKFAMPIALHNSVDYQTLGRRSVVSGT